MGSEFFRLYSLVLIVFGSIRTEFISSGVLTHSASQSIRLAFDQIHQSTTFHRKLVLSNDSNETVPCDFGNSIKLLFDMINRNPTLNVLITDLCQNVLHSIAETARFLKLPMFSFTESDLSLSATDRRLDYFFNIVPSDHAHNLVRKQILERFNWKRFGLIYQHGSKYTLSANDFTNLISLEERQWQINLTRGIPYRHGAAWHEDNRRDIKGLLRDFKNKDVRIIVANVNQTVARHLFCHAASEHIYGARYQWIIHGFSSLIAWWNEPDDCPIDDFIRAINGTFQTRIPTVSFDESIQSRSRYDRNQVDFDRNYFDAYAYDAIWSLAYLNNDSFPKDLQQRIEQLDFYGATGRVRFFNGERLGEIVVEQYVACRMMNDGSCQIPCYADESHCNLTLVKIFLSKHDDSKSDPPKLYPLASITWHGQDPPRDQTNQTVVFEHISLSVFISIMITSTVGLVFSSLLFIFNIHFRSHRYIRMSSPSLNNLILVGCMLAYLSIIVMGMNASLFSSDSPIDTIMNIICPTRLWLLCLSFTLAFGSMFSKTWRVHSIFTNINITKKGIHDSRLLFMVGVLVFIDLSFLIAWQIFDPIHRELTYPVSHRLPSNPDVEIFPYHEECRSEHISIWCVILILYKGLLMLYGSFLSWKTRHVTVPALNDSRHIGLSVYIVFICCTLGSLVTFIPSEQIQLSYLLSSFFILLCTSTTVSLVFVPKVVEVYNDPHSRKRQPRITARLNRHTSGLTSILRKNFEAARNENEHLHYVLAMQEQTLFRLVNQFNQYENDQDLHIEGKALEIERLIVPDSREDEQVDDEDDSNYQLVTNQKVYHGSVARAVSVCLFNKIHKTSMYWPETLGNNSTSTTNARSTEENPNNPILHDFSNETIEQRQPFIDENFTSIDFDFNYEGLQTLDETLLEQMTETDLISSSFMIDE